MVLKEGALQFALVAEAAREVAEIGDLDKDAFEFFQRGMFSRGGHRKGADAALIYGGINPMARKSGGEQK